MFKMHGKEYKVSVFKFILPDIIANELEELTKEFKLENNTETVASCIHVLFLLMKKDKELESYKNVPSDAQVVNGPESLVDTLEIIREDFPPESRL